MKYSNESPPSPSEYLKAILAEIRKRNLMNLKVIVEPGRSIVANAGILVTRVLFLKVSYTKVVKFLDPGQVLAGTELALVLPTHKLPVTNIVEHL